MARYVVVLLAVALLAWPAASTVYSDSPPAAGGTAAQGKMAPDFTLKDRDGKEWKLSSLRGKRIVLMDFGRSFCVPCKSVARDLQALHKEYAAKGVQVLAINLDAREIPTLPALVDAYKLTFPILLDWQFEAARAYGLTTIPYLVLVDKKGIVRYVHVGYSEDFTKTFKSKIESLLAEQSAKPKPAPKKPAKKPAKARRHKR